MGAAHNDDDPSLKAEMAKALKQALNFSQDTAVNIARIDERVATLKSSMEGLSKLLFVGNGKPSLVTQLAELGQTMLMLQGEISSLTQGMGSLRNSIVQIERDGKEMEKIRQSNRTSIKVAIISAASSILVSIIGGLALYYARHPN